MLPLFLLFAVISLAQPHPPSITEASFQNRKAWILENGLIRIAVLSGGGHIGEARLMTGDPKKDVNPMRVPHYPTIDPHTYDPAKHDALYGTGSSRWLMSGYMGHLVCFPSYGSPSEPETKAGLGGHGEAPMVEWKKISAEATPQSVTLKYAADLKMTEFRMGRTITLRRGDRHIRVEEWVENLAPFDRPVNWMQHATFGPPFVEPGKTAMDVSATRGQVSGGRVASLQPGSEVNWPRGTTADGKPADLRVFQPKSNSGVYYTMRMDPSRQEQFFAMYHPSSKVLIGYVFPAADNPWIADWQENRSSTATPWDSKVIARGIEFGSSPFDEGLRKSVERATFLNTPTYRWIGGRQRLTTEWTLMLQEIPEGFAGVADLRTVNGAPVLTPRK